MFWKPYDVSFCFSSAARVPSNGASDVRHDDDGDVMILIMYIFFFSPVNATVQHWYIHASVPRLATFVVQDVLIVGDLLGRTPRHL